MTNLILSLLRPRVKPLPDSKAERVYRTGVGQALRLGDRVREVNSWADDFRFRTGRAA